MKHRGIVLLLIGLHVGFSTEAAAQRLRIPRPDAALSDGLNRLSLELGILGASLAYSRLTGPRVALGIEVTGGAQAGFMTSSGEITGDGSTPSFIELLSGAAFLRVQPASRIEVDGGVRAGWFYHPPTEYESIFKGIYSSLHYRFGAVRVGPRIYWGEVSEEAGRTQSGFAVVPLTARVTWSW
ncbi:MAG TPA: hypothetical protein VFZ24_12430 [Longimicrobiales bacterium]